MPASFVAAREEQQLLGQRREPFGLVGGVLDRVLELVAAAMRTPGKLQLGAEHAERRAELVTGVSHERTLATQRAVEVFEQSVHRGRERRDLVVGARGRAASLPSRAR